MCLYRRPFTVISIQAYEHNLAAVEKHIENLATRSVGARASPASAAAAALDAARGAQRMARNGGGSTLNSQANLADILGGSGFAPGRGGGGGSGGGVGVPYGGGVRFTPA